MGFAAGLGSVARGRNWVDAAGKFVLSKFMTEGATALGLAIGIVALGDKFALDMKLVAGLCVFAGWLGPAAVSDFVLKKFGVNLGN